MKYISAALCLVVLLACNSTSKIGSETLKGKLVVSELCAHYVVLLSSGKIDKDKIAVNWMDDKRKTTYEKSFTVANRCSFEKAGLKEGDEFTFTLDTDSTNETCAVCMAYYPTPPQLLSIKNIKKINP